MDLERLKAVQAQKAQQAKDEAQDSRTQLANLSLQETIVKTAKMVVDYMDGKVTKTAVINQIEGYATSADSKEITEALGSLHETLKTHENVDLTPLTEVMNNVLKEAKLIPKTQKEVKIPEAKDYSKQFSDLSTLLGKVEKAIEAQETNVEAPVVNVDAPDVKVDAPDLKPLTKDINSVEKAIKKIVIPAQIKTDTTKIENELKASNKLLKDIRDTPSGGSGGGSTGIAPFLEQGALPVSQKVMTERYDYDDPTTIYTATAVTGTAEASTGWTITKYDLTNTNNASGKIATDVSWSGRALGTYL